MLGLSWWGMMLVHELGHVLAAWTSGGRVTHIELHPLAISRTDVSPNPHPLWVAWSGPVFGSLAPVAMWLVARWRRASWQFLVRFFAGFCLIANGAYLGGGSFQAIGDCGTLLRHGTPIVCLWVFGLLGLVSGIACWHHLGPAFDIGTAARPVNPRHSYVCAGLFGLMIVIAWLLRR